jgi:hypothetical protein
MGRSPPEPGSPKTVSNDRPNLGGFELYHLAPVQQN